MIKAQLLKPVYWFFNTIVAPPFCASCKIFLSARAIFCDRCRARICPIVSSDLRINKNYTMSIFAISDYQEPLKSLIVAKSWSDSVASQQLGQLIWDMTNFRESACDILIPVPLHWMRAVSRGFNQAEIMAQVLAKKKGAGVLRAVKRIKRTPFQSGLAVQERPGNVRHAFAATAAAEKIAGKHIMIVDDLMTTGATLKSVAQELVAYKPASINAVVACRVV